MSESHGKIHNSPGSNAITNNLPQQAVSKDPAELPDQLTHAPVQNKLQQTANNSAAVKQLKQYQQMANRSAQVTQLQSVQAIANAQPRRTDAPVNSSPIQFVHPAFNSINFWRPDIEDPETNNRRPHPLSPEGKKISLTNEFGAEVMKIILYTTLPDDAAIERENMTRQFYRGGGNPWDAIRLLERYPVNNQDLNTAYHFCLTGETGLVAYVPGDLDAPGVRDNIDRFSGLTDDTVDSLLKDLIKMARVTPTDAPALRPQIIALNVVMKERLRAEKGDYDLLNSSVDGGTQVAFFGSRVHYRDQVVANAAKVTEGLLGSAFIITRRPPLKIRINVNPGVSRDIANTVGNGSFIVININQYQLVDFTPGQLLGLLAHEVGVHSLEATTLSPQERAAELADINSSQQGAHGGKQYTVGKQAGANMQQDDHLTIGRGLLGQISGLPRLNMYERTIVTIINAMSVPDERKEAAATYCIDIARIIVLNDNPEAVAGMSKWATAQLGMDIVTASVSEWQRMKAKYGATNPRIQAIDIGKMYMIQCLFKLQTLLARIQREGT